MTGPRRLGERIGSDRRRSDRRSTRGLDRRHDRAAAEQLAALRDAGVDRVMCQHLLHDDLDVLALIAELAPGVG